MPEHQHPDWAAVGATVLIQRRGSTGYLAHERTATVTRHTPKAVVADGQRFVNRGGDYVLTPRYLDYRTVLLPAEDGGR